MIRTILRRVVFGWVILICWPIIYGSEWLFDSEPSANDFVKFIWYGGRSTK